LWWRLVPACPGYVIGSRKLEKNSKFFCAQRIKKRPTDLKALFLHKVFQI
jgi:hypothetical protein